MIIKNSCDSKFLILNLFYKQKSTIKCKQVNFALYTKIVKKNKKISGKDCLKYCFSLGFSTILVLKFSKIRGQNLTHLNNINFQKFHHFSIYFRFLIIYNFFQLEQGQWARDIVEDVALVTRFRENVEYDRYLKNKFNHFSSAQAKKIAHAGFYFTKYEKELPVIQCFSCRMELNGNRKWLAANVNLEHYKHRPNCSMIQSQDSEHVVGSI